MRQLDLSGFAPEPAPSSDPDPSAAIVDGTLAQALNNDFIARQQALLHDGPDAFYRNQGADALAATPAVLDQLDALRNQLLDTTTNTRQRQILAQSLDNHLAVSKADVARHASQQTLAWQNATAQTRLALLQKQAGFDYGDPDSIANYAEAGRSAALHQAETAGLPHGSDAAQEQASAAASAIWRAAIEAAIAREDFKPAVALHEQAAGRLSPTDAAALGRYIDEARERETARDYVARLALPERDPSLPMDLERSLAALEAGHAAATARNSDDWPEDASQRATNQHFIDVRFGQKRRDAILAKTDLDDAVNNWLAIPRQTERPPLDLWIRLHPDQQRTVDLVLAKNARLDQDEQPVVEDGSSTHVDIMPVADRGFYDECHEECREKAEAGTTYGGADRFFSYRRCMRECLQEKGDFDYLRSPKH
jgi:hypothetical protein